MKVLFHTSIVNFQKANGGKTVVLKTKEYLERAGIQVDLFDPWRTDIKDYDLIHCFTLHTTDLWQFVKDCDLKLAVTPLNWFGVYATPRSRAFRWLKRKVRGKIHCPLHSYWWEDCFGFPDVFFPQSELQARQLGVAFGVSPNRIVPVHHGVDARFSAADPTLFTDRYRLTDFVLCVARFEPTKNQLGLIRALKGTGIPLVFVGRPDSERFASYYAQCVAEAGDSALFLGELSHESPMLASGYAAARVLALPSFLEYPGVVVLEAGLAGCNVAVTREGTGREYLGPHARYLDPRSAESIRQTVLECYQHGPRPNTALQEHIRRHYLWETVIRGNIDGYHRILGSTHGRAQPASRLAESAPA